MQKSAGNQSFRELNEGKTSSGIGFKFSLMYPTEGGINALLFPVKDVKVIWLNLLSRNSSYRNTNNCYHDELEIP